MMRFSSVLVVLAAWALAAAQQAAAELSANDALFYRTRLAAIEMQLQTWRTSGAPDAANQIRILQTEQRLIHTQLQIAPSPPPLPRPPCDPREPSFCGLLPGN